MGGESGKLSGFRTHLLGVAAPSFALLLKVSVYCLCSSGGLAKDLLSESVTHIGPSECSLESSSRIGVYVNLEKGLSNPFPEIFPKKFKNLIERKMVLHFIWA